MTGPARLLDSDTLRLLRDGHPAVFGRVNEYPADHLYTSAVNVEEAVSGWYTFLRQAKRPEDVERAYEELVRSVKFFARVQVLPYDRRAIAEYEQLKRLKLNVGASDLKIAAVARVHGATVVTRNRRDFDRVPGLRCEDWALADPPSPV